MTNIINFLRESKINEYTNIMSNEDLIKMLLSQSKKAESKKLSEKKESIKAIADVFQSITTSAMTINELMSYLYNNYDDDALKQLGTFITIIHGNGDNKLGDPQYKIVNRSKLKAISKDYSKFIWAESHFSLPKKIPTVKNGLYDHGDTYGLLGASYIDKNPNNANTDVYTTEGICHAKAAAISSDSQTGKKPGENNLVNAVTNENYVATTKTKPSLAYVLIDQPDLRIGTRNSLELATFFNLLSTVELSKCLPYLNATFILPSLIDNKNSNRAFKTASITQFFDGTPISKDAVTDNYNILEASFKRKLKTKNNKEEIIQDAVGTNMSAFTMPQTVNNFNETFIGHNENVKLNTDLRFTRSTSVHDIARPFLTIKSFSIDVAPTQGLMSFKTGKLSLILHDKTRMVDIAPFIKPDLFGSFGAEIAIEYGWSHIDSEITNNASFDHSKVRNYLGEFLNASRVTEKYIITNSSFSMDNTGQINIELSIAMRGPVDIRSVKLHSDPIVKLKAGAVNNSASVFINAIDTINSSQSLGSSSLSFKYDENKSGKKIYHTHLNIVENITHSLINEINSAGNTTGTLAAADLKKLQKVKTAYLKNNNKFKKMINAATYPSDFVEAFTFLDPKNTNKKQPHLLGVHPLLKFKEMANDPTQRPNNYKSGPKNQYLHTQYGNKKYTLHINDLSMIKSNILKLGDYLSVAEQEYLNPLRKALAAEKKLINKLIGGLDKIDPFYNTLWLKQFSRIIEENKKTHKGLTIRGIGTKSGPTSYVSFGSFLTGLIGTHLTNTGKFNEVQVISYTCNEHCGLMSNLNVSSLLLPKKELRTFLGELFTDNATFTLEGIISQVINRFISTRTNICYGLHALYERDPKTGNVKAKHKSKMQKKLINDKLRRIYYLLANITADPTSPATGIPLDDVKFVMPKIKFTFDTLTSKKSGYDLTISRISIFDQNDNPFGSLNTIMNKVYDKGIIAVSAQLNKIRQDFNSKETKTVKTTVKSKNYTPAELEALTHNNPYSPETQAYRDFEAALIEAPPIGENPYDVNISPAQYQQRAEELKNFDSNSKKKWKYKTIKQKKLVLTKEKFYRKSWSYIQQLLNEGKLIEISPGVYEINDQFKLDTLKSSFKNIMPSLTYGTQNSAIIEASVSTVNEAKLNTVYLTRSDRAADDKNKIAAKVAFAKDLPLRVLPSQATVTLFGCPFVNFAQYIFLDFETGTTIDNSYAVTGIKHDLTPGKFTTQLTLSYGDVYGKYENAAQTIARTINDIAKPITIESAESASDEISINTWGKKPEKVEIGNESIGGEVVCQYRMSINEYQYLAYKKEWKKYYKQEKEYKFFITVIPTFTNAVWFKNISTNSPGKEIHKKMYIAINAKIADGNSLDSDNALNKSINIDIDLLKHEKKFFDIYDFRTDSGGSTSLKDLISKQTPIIEVRNIDPFKEMKIASKKVFASNASNTFYFFKNNNQRKFVEEAIKKKMISLKFNLKFTYNGIEADYSGKNKPSGWPLEPKLNFDWDLSNPVKNYELYKKYFSHSIVENLSITKNYNGYVKSLVKDIKKIKNIKKSKYANTSIYKKSLVLSTYTKNNKVDLTLSGLEFEIISGVENVTKHKVKNKKHKEVRADFVYKKVVIGWKVLFNAIHDINTQYPIVKQG